MFRFYILFLLGFMSGIAAGTGSRFMNGKMLGPKKPWKCSWRSHPGLKGVARLP